MPYDHLLNQSRRPSPQAYHQRYIRPDFWCRLTVYRTRDAARTDVFDYIEWLYNPKRRNSTLGYLTVAFEARAMHADFKPRAAR